MRGVIRELYEGKFMKKTINEKLQMKCCYMKQVIYIRIS